MSDKKGDKKRCPYCLQDINANEGACNKCKKLFFLDSIQYPSAKPTKNWFLRHKALTIPALIVIVLIEGFFASAFVVAFVQVITAERETVEVKELQSIPYSTIETEDNALNEGYTTLKQSGKDGYKESIFEVTYTDGKETKRKLLSENVLDEPIPQITLIGSKTVEESINRSAASQPSEAIATSPATVPGVQSEAYASPGTKTVSNDSSPTNDQEKQNPASQEISITPSENIEASTKNVSGDKFRKVSFDPINGAVTVDLNIGEPKKGVANKEKGYKSALETAKRIYFDEGAARMTNFYIYGKAKDETGKMNDNAMIMEVHLSKAKAENINDGFSDWNNFPALTDSFKEYVDIDNTLGNIESSIKNASKEKFRKVSFDPVSRITKVDLNIGEPKAGTNKVKAYAAVLETAKRVYFDEGAALMTYFYIYGKAKDVAGTMNDNTLIMEVHLSKAKADVIKDGFSDWNNFPALTDAFNEFVDVDRLLEIEAEKQKKEKEENLKEKTYLAKVTKLADGVSTAANDLAEALNDNPFPFLWSQEEVLKLAANTVTIEMAYDDAQKMDVPDRYKDSHNSLLIGLKKYAEAMPLFREGLDNLDADKINSATALLLEGAGYINEATDKFPR